MPKNAYHVHLVNMQNSLHRSVSTFIDAARLKQYHHDDCMKLLAPARKKLNAAGVVSQVQLFLGDPVDVATRFAKEQGGDKIVIGTRYLPGISSLVVRSVETKIIDLTGVRWYS